MSEQVEDDKQVKQLKQWRKIAVILALILLIDLVIKLEIFVINITGSSVSISLNNDFDNKE